MNFKDKRKSRGIALQADYDDMSTKDETNEDEDLSESLTLLTKNFNKMLRKINKKGRFGENSKNRNSQKKNFNSQQFEENERNKEIQCRECEGFRHIQAECANTLKKRNKAATTSTWSDDSDEKFVATASATTSGGVVDDTDFEDETEDDSDDDDLSLEKIQEAYKKMYSKWLVVCKQNKSLEDEVAVLTKERDELKKATTNYEILATKHHRKVAETRIELEQTQKNLRMLNSGLGYKGQEISEKTVFVKGATNTMMQSFKKSQDLQSGENRVKKIQKSMKISICVGCSALGASQPETSREHSKKEF
ncbi:uncharacterized protein LOC112093655 [Morus notabilis]|uniref:uncharacterized protein LOC112093655 n=1 Tax=Morus notabilis TaxID=981085 RepID=UPI000CECE7F4|nr:uncharacterized protein LOC112093655 [Morus notabilis]